MKKAIKITMIIAVGMIVTGLGMAFVSLASTGFQPQKWLNTREYEEKTYDVAEDFSDMSLNIGSQGVMLCKSDDDETHFVCYETDKEYFDVKVENETLMIEQVENYSWRNNFMVSINLQPCRLYLPKEEYDDLKVDVGSGDFEAKTALTLSNVDIKLGSGDVSLQNLKMKDLTAKSGSGNVEIADTYAKSAILKTGSGAIRIRNTDIKEALSGECSSGSLTLDTLKCDRASIYSGSGSVTANDVLCENGLEGSVGSGSFKLQEVVSKGDFVLKSGSGSIKFESCDGKNMNLKTSSGSIRGSIKSGKVFDATSGSGDVEVPQNDRKGGECILHTGSGDITITYADEK